MKIKDARSLSPEAQEELRFRAVDAVNNGMKRVEAAKIFKVSRQIIGEWVKKYEEEGKKSLKSKPKGRPKKSRLKAHEAALIVKIVKGKCPEQLNFPFYLWTREAVMSLIEEKFNIVISKWTVGRYLKNWGFTPQKPLRRAYERNPEKVEKWLKEEYPQIKERSKNENAEIYWGDEMGLRSDHQAGRTYGIKGETPVISGTGKRFRCNMISAITNRGQLSFMVFDEKFTASVFTRFLYRLTKSASRKIYFITDSHPVHVSKKAKKWLEQNKNKIEMFYLPPYSPELNPDELLNNDVKTNGLGRTRPKTQDEMKKNTRAYLRSRMKTPQIIKNFFKKQQVNYAA